MTTLIGERWLAARTKLRIDGKKVSQTQLAGLLGISTSYLSLIESGQRTNPSRELIKRASEVTGRSFKYLAGE